jgi:hypothetical protein
MVVHLLFFLGIVARPIALVDVGRTSLLKERGIPIYGYIGSWAIANYERDAFEEVGLKPLLVFERKGEKEYYLLSIPEENLKKLPDGVRVIFRDGRNTLLEAKRKDAESLSLLGYGLTRISFRVKPLEKRGQGMILQLDPLLEEVAGLVSEDSLQTYVMRLQAFQTRYSYTDSCQAAGDWIYSKFQEFGVPVQFFYYNYEGETWKDVVATIEGTAQPDEIYVVCGHYDSISDDPWYLAPGADDNGSGTALVLEVARVLSQYTFDKTIMFICFSGEEQGLIGSEAFVSWATSQGYNFSGVINTDMVAYVADPPYDTWDINIYADDGSISLAQTLADLASQYTSGTPNVDNTGTPFYGSDHYYFAVNGYPAVGVIDAWPPWYAPDWDPYYHTTNDIWTTLDFSFHREVAKLAAVALASLAGIHPRDSLDPLPPESLTAYSDYTTPTSISLNWRDPTETVGGAPLTNLAGILVFFDNDSLIDTVQAGVEHYEVQGLTDGVLYGFYLVAFTEDDSLSLPTPVVSWYCGGHPVPSPPESLSVSLDPIVPRRVHISWRDPTTQVDGTPLDDLLAIRIYEANGDTLVGEVLPGVESFTLDLAPHGLLNFYLTAVDNEIPQHESDPTEEGGVTVGPFFSFDFESGTEGWTHQANPGWQDQWHLDSYRNHTPGGSTSWKCGGVGPGDYANNLDALLISPELPLRESSVILIWHWMEAETSDYYDGEAYDGGLLEVSLDGGVWTRIDPDGGYPYVSRGSGPFGYGTPIFSGTFDWRQDAFHLSLSQSGVVQVRFRFGSDGAVTREGWYVDDVLIGPLNAPGLLLYPQVVTGTVTHGAIDTFLVGLGNQGFEDLNFQWDQSSIPQWLSVDPMSGVLLPDDTTTLLLIVDASNLGSGSYWDTLELFTNDPVMDTVGLYLALTVIGYLVGDANGDGIINSLDIVYLAAYLYQGGPPPDPILSGDANGDCTVSALDIVYLAQFLYEGGPQPIECTRTKTLLRKLKNPFTK